MASPHGPRGGQGPKVAYLIGRLDRALRRRLTETLLPFGLSVAQYTTLSVLQIRGESSNAQLASRAFISPQAMNEVVQGLESRKLVTRRPDPLHGRIVKLLLTERGLEIVRQSDAAVRQLEQSMLQGLSAAAQETFRSMLSGCVQVLEQRAIEAKTALRAVAPATRRARS